MDHLERKSMVYLKNKLNGWLIKKMLIIEINTVLLNIDFNQLIMSNIFSNQIINPYFKELPRFTPKIKLGILASGKGSNLEAIIQDINRNILDAEIMCLIVNNNNCGAIEKAKKYNIPYSIIIHQEYKTRESLDEAIISKFNSYNVEAIVMVGWMRIVTNILLKEFRGKVINLHPSLLPSFKGKDSIKQALKNKVKFTGSTVHLVEEEVDSGEILVQTVLPINDSDNEDLLRERIKKQEHKIISLGIALAAMRWRK